MDGAERQRRLALAGATNFRDLGGYAVGEGRRTRWGKLFRSDSLADLTSADLEALHALGLHLLIDFRLPMERQRHPNRLPPGNLPRTVEIGFMPEGTLDMLRRAMLGTLDAVGVDRELEQHYRRFPAAHAREYAEMFDHIEQAAGQPVLIHCTSGKDRTGFGAAMLLLALGASRPVVLQDYALTSQYRRDIGKLFAAPLPQAVMAVLTAAPPKYLAAALGAIDQGFGGTEAYLERALGLTPARRARLLAWFTEPA